jgi:hypothetical protein
MINTSRKKSNLWLWVLLIATALLTIWTAINSETDNTDNSIELAAPETKTKKIQLSTESSKQEANETLNPTTSIINWDKLERNGIITSSTKDLFRPHSWVIIPPAPKIKPAPPPPPVAPPSPFTYFGKIEEGPKGTLLFLIANNKVYSVKKGEKIDSFWRYDSEDANNVYMTYLPLNLRQVLSKNQKTAAPLQENVPADFNYEGN